jgi:hypothetical protein
MDAIGRLAEDPRDQVVTTTMGEWAPVALFIYKRPEHTHRMISSLQACVGYAESPVFVFADGPAHSRDLPAVQRTRALARSLLNDRAELLERETNLGIDKSVIAGVTQLCDRFGKVVVVEDDLVVSPLFLQFLNRGLWQYENEPRVMQVSGHMFDVPQIRQQNAAIFLPMTTSWGWATWKRAWDHLDSMNGWRARLGDHQVRRRFDLDDKFAYSTMLAKEMRRETAAWDIRWYYTVFARDGLALFPPRTLVFNGGLDGSGTHHRMALPTHQAPLETAASFDLPTDVAESRQKEHVFEAISSFRPRSALRRLMAPVLFVLRKLRVTTV